MMSPLYNFISTAVYNRISQSPELQMVSVGIQFLHQGKQLLCGPDLSSQPSVMKKIGQKTAGVALLAGGLAGVYYGSMPLLQASVNQLKSMFLFGQPPAQPIEDDYEQHFKRNSFSKNYINAECRYRRPSIHQAKSIETEVLYLAAGSEADNNGALNPLNFVNLPLCLNEISKLKYKTIHHPLQICEEIHEQSKSGLVQNLVINAHGNMVKMKFSPTSMLQVFDKFPLNCFDGLSPTARIFLKSCKTGKNSLWQPNIAEWISWNSERTVIASSESTVSGRSWIANDQLHISLESSPINCDDNDLEAESCFSLVDYTAHFNTSARLTEQALFSIKLIAPTVLGAVTTWQTMRFGATLLQGGGAAAEWLVDRSAAPTRKLAEKVGVYNPLAAQTLYTTAKVTSKILNSTGKTVHQGMDKLMEPVNMLGNWALGKSIKVTTNLAQRLFARF